MYISKGMVARPSTEELLFVTRCGVEFRLTGIEADLWLDGRFSFAYEKTEEQKIVRFSTWSTLRIHPNDLCPCGSGKCYRKCCGRKKV